MPQSQLLQTFEKFLLPTETGNQVEIRYLAETKQVSVIDVICAISSKDARYASNAVNRMRDDLKSQFTYHKFPRARNSTPMATAEVIINVIWELPGSAAREFRRQSARAICQQLHDDLEMAARLEPQSQAQRQTQSFLQGGLEIPAQAVPEILEAQPVFPIPAAAPATPAVPTTIFTSEAERKRCFELSIQQVEQHLELQRKESCERSVAFYEKFAKSEMCQNDAKMLAVVHDNIMNSLQPRSSIATSDEDPWVDDFSTLLRNHNVLFNNDMLGKLGRFVSQRHIEVYGYRNEDKSTKFVNGANRPVAVYSKDKKRFVEDCINEFLKKQQTENESKQLKVVPKLQLKRK